jgi:hypothetical protein
MTDLKALLGARLLTVIQESRDRPSDYLVCVCDDYTTRILSSCLRVHAINDAGIGAVVNIRFPRESLPSTPVMYLMHPNADNWKFLLDDFKKQPKYGYVYLYTTAPVAPDLMQMLQGGFFWRLFGFSLSSYRIADFGKVKGVQGGECRFPVD